MEEPSNPKPSLKPSSVRPWAGNREVLHEAGEVAEPKVDDLDPFVLHEADDLGGAALLHDGRLLCDLVEQRLAARGH